MIEKISQSTWHTDPDGLSRVTGISTGDRISRIGLAQTESLVNSFSVSDRSNSFKLLRWFLRPSFVGDDTFRKE
jgi:hypothetical protein